VTRGRPDWKVEGIERVESRRLPEGEDSFLTLEKMRCRTRYRGGERSETYSVDCVHRRGWDSVAIVLYDDSGEELLVGVRRAVRPILFLRSEAALPIPDGRRYRMVWEAVAGSLEPGDEGEEGLRRRLVEEVWEEAGLRIDRASIEPLGGGFYPSHGQSSEKIHLRAARVRVTEQQEAPGSGSPLEEVGGTRFLEAREVLRMCRDGRIEDPKVEIGIARLLERLGR
jgi:8-oxo-dGTP pyrophosphatase MutT (NUDIX family)